MTSSEGHCGKEENNLFCFCLFACLFILFCFYVFVSFCLFCFVFVFVCFCFLTAGENKLILLPNIWLIIGFFLTYFSWFFVQSILSCKYTSEINRHLIYYFNHVYGSLKQCCYVCTLYLILVNKRRNIFHSFFYIDYRRKRSRCLCRLLCVPLWAFHFRPLPMFVSWRNTLATDWELHSRNKNFLSGPWRYENENWLTECLFSIFSKGWLQNPTTDWPAVLGCPVRFRPVSVVLNNDNRPEPTVKRRLGFEVTPSQVVTGSSCLEWATRRMSRYKTAK